MTDSVAEPRTFERALTELEDCVRRLDSGTLPLEDALNLFESGSKLQQECQDLLDASERRIVELTGTTEHINEDELA